MRLSDFLFNIGRPVAFYPGLVKALGSMKQAVFICQMAYWKDKGSDPDGWIYKTSDEIEEETSLTYKEQTTVRAALVEKNALEERYARTEHQMYFRVNWEVVNNLWDEHLTNGHMPKGRLASSQRATGILPKGVSLNSNTDTTQKNTTERKPASLDFKSMTVKDAYQVPSLILYKDAAEYFPPSQTWEFVHNTITEHSLTSQRISEASQAWAAAGFKPGNIKGILEWAVNGIPEKYQIKITKPSTEIPRPNMRELDDTTPMPFVNVEIGE